MDEKEKFWEDTPEEAEHRKTVEEAGKKAMLQLNDDSGFWKRWGKLSPKDPQNVTREPVNAMSGAIELGGGSKSGKKHKNPIKKAPEYMKYLGM